MSGAKKRATRFDLVLGKERLHLLGKILLFLPRGRPQLLVPGFEGVHFGLQVRHAAGRPLGGDHDGKEAQSQDERGGDNRVTVFDAQKVVHGVDRDNGLIGQIVPGGGPVDGGRGGGGFGGLVPGRRGSIAATR